MKDFGISADINWESGLRETLGLIPSSEFFDFFYTKNYGYDLNSVFVMLMCRNNELNFKQRIRFLKKEKALYMDIMLDFNLFVKITQLERNKIVFDKLKKEVPEIIARYKFKDFDLARFTDDFTELINRIEY